MPLRLIMKPSIRRRLLVTLLTIITLVWLFTALSSYQETQHEIEELFDAQLAQSARTLLTVAGHELDELEGIPETTHIHFLPGDTGDEDGIEYEQKLAYQLWILPQNKLILRSFMAPETPLSPILSGYSSEVINGQPWRVFSLHEPKSGFQIKMAESLEIRQELTDEITQRMAIPMLIALPLLALLIYLGIGRGLLPLQRLAHSIARREPGRLERVDTSNIPREIEPLVAALNQLFERVEGSMEHERRFTADAAHELRTPLAALKVQAQVALHSRDEAERTHALEQVVNGVVRASRLVEQLLTLARIDPETARGEFVEFALLPLAEEALAALEPFASEKQITLQLQCTSRPRLTGEAQSLAIALRNLTDNAIRYTPPGGTVEIRIEEGAETLQLCIADSGPGIPESERERIFNRFYRLAGQQTEGSGLGFSIVQRIAELHQASVTLQRSRLGGLAVCLNFPLSS